MSSPTPQVILAPGTAAANSSEFDLAPSQVPALVVMAGLATTETGTVQAADMSSGSAVWANLNTASVPQMTATGPAVIINAPGRYRAAKSATAAAVGATLYNI